MDVPVIGGVWDIPATSVENEYLLLLMRMLSETIEEKFNVECNLRILANRFIFSAIAFFAFLFFYVFVWR